VWLRWRWPHALLEHVTTAVHQRMRVTPVCCLCGGQMRLTCVCVCVCVCGVKKKRDGLVGGATGARSLEHVHLVPICCIPATHFRVRAMRRQHHEPVAAKQSSCLRCCGGRLSPLWPLASWVCQSEGMLRPCGLFSVTVHPPPPSTHTQPLLHPRPARNADLFPARPRDWGPSRPPQVKLRACEVQEAAGELLHFYPAMTHAATHSTQHARLEDPAGLRSALVDCRYLAANPAAGGRWLRVCPLSLAHLVIARLRLAAEYVCGCVVRDLVGTTGVSALLLNRGLSDCR
jgi:hypothetical protein